MAKIQLDVPDDIHLKVKHLQLSNEAKGEKATLKELYIELIRKAIEKK